jgi:hypothetical protein
MAAERVFFGGVGKDRVEYLYDRSRLQLGSTVYVSFDSAGRATSFSPEPVEEAEVFYVHWISPSEWYVPLYRPPQGDAGLVKVLHAELGSLLREGDAEKAVAVLVKRLRPAHLFKTDEVRRNPVTLLRSVCARLDLCRRLRQPEVEKTIAFHHQPLVTYLLLTCFDRLGQPADWVDFSSWLTSRRHSSEREEAAAQMPASLDARSCAERMYDWWKQRYGVRSAFYRFIREVLPEGVRIGLFRTIQVFKSKLPPSLEKLPVSDSDKEDFLYRVRNDYTHRSAWVGGVGDSQMLLPAGWPRDRVTTIFGSEVHAHHTEQVWVLGWPWPLDRAVREGLAAYVRNVADGGDGPTSKG